METIKKNTKSIALVAGFAAVTVSVFVLFKKFKNTKTVKELPLMKALTKDEKDKILSQIKIVRDGQQYLSADTVVEISKAMREIGIAESTNLTMTNIKLRRAHKNNFVQYAKTCEEFLGQLNDLVRRDQKSVLESFGISEFEWEININYHLRRGEPKLAALQAYITGAQAERMKSVRALKFDEFKAALIRYTELLETEILNVPNVQRMLKNPQYAGTILDYKIHDIVFEELGVEDEEFVLGIQTFVSQFNKEDRELLQRYVQATQSLGVLD